MEIYQKCYLNSSVLFEKRTENSVRFFAVAGYMLANAAFICQNIKMRDDFIFSFVFVHVYNLRIIARLVRELLIFV